MPNYYTNEIAEVVNLLKSSNSSSEEVLISIERLDGIQTQLANSSIQEDHTTEALWQSELLQRVMSIANYLERGYDKSFILDMLLEVVDEYLLEFNRFQEQWERLRELNAIKRKDDNGAVQT